jgi:hypothetical protein
MHAYDIQGILLDDLEGILDGSLSGKGNDFY